jgi:hypothetical protein
MHSCISYVGVISHRFEVRILIGTDDNTKEGEEMQNVEWEIKDHKLIIEIDLTKDFGPSKSGKTITIASTRGNQKVEGTNAIIGLNVYKYPESV